MTLRLYDTRAQALEILRRHPKQAAIVYCLSRNDTESMAGWLQTNGVRAAFYHAGMEADERRRTQDDFAAEALDVVAATVAFGMGIDRSDVRCVIHAAMPKSRSTSSPASRRDRPSRLTFVPTTESSPVSAKWSPLA